MKRLAICFMALAGALCARLQADINLTLDPVGGALTGSPGQTVGWGFILENTTTNYLLVTSADYVTVTPLGTFTDYISAFNFIVVGPSPESSSVTQAFDSGALAGVGAYQIDWGP